MRSIGPEIWIEDQPSHVPLFGNFGIRMTVIRLKSKELMIISPVPLNEVLRAEIESLGPVRFIMGPNSMHHLSLRKYHEAFPEAQLAAPVKLQAKRKNLAFQITLKEGEKYPWSDEVDILLVDSKTKLSEVVFLHKPSRTLILTDLLFNLPAPQTLVQKLAYAANGLQKQPMMSRLARIFFNDRPHLRKKVDEISRWDFDQIVIAHGNIIENSGKRKFLDSFQWLQA